MIPNFHFALITWRGLRNPEMERLSDLAYRPVPVRLKARKCGVSTGQGRVSQQDFECAVNVGTAMEMD
jgi:hypothetical protein